jgi:hypothetical protein
MVFELMDTGERVKINATEEQFTTDNGRNYLHSEQVLVIVKEDLRRIFIWKGAKSSVRKRFISSKVAGELQDELIKQAAFHRCKIISVDQGEEVEEFLSTFRLVSMPVEEKLADMRYIRNIDRQKMADAGVVPEESPKFVKIDKKKEPEVFVSPALQELEKIIESKDVVPLPEGSLDKSKKEIRSKKQKYQPAHPISQLTSQQVTQFSDTQKKNIMEKILKTEVPEGYKRQNLILGHTLYGAVFKKVNVFGKNIEETEWEKVNKLPKGTIEIENSRLRVYFDHENAIVEALEILEKSNGQNMSKVNRKEPDTTSNDVDQEKQLIKSSTDFETWTVKDLKIYCADHKIDIPSNARKADILKILEEIKTSPKKVESESSPDKSLKRKLPEIPRG